MGPADHIREALESAVVEAGLELWDVEVHSNVVRVLIDRPAGVDLSALSDVSRALSALLDERDDLAPQGRYDLEVSSPGIERPLRLPEHFARFVGSQVALKTSEPVAGSRRLRGELSSTGQNGVVVCVEGEKTSVDVPYALIQSAHTVMVWETPSKPGRAKRNVASQVAANAASEAVSSSSSISSAKGEQAQREQVLAGADFEDVTR